MGEGGIIAISIITIIVVLICNAILASEFKTVAISKGYEDNKYFWYCFLFGICGMLLIIALPNQYSKNANSNTIQKMNSPNKPQSNKRNSDKTIMPSIENDGRKTCLYCFKKSSPDSTECQYCGAKFSK